MHYNTKLIISGGEMCCCTLCATFTVCFIDAKLLEDICIFFLREHVLLNIYTLIQQVGHAVAQLVEALRYKPEGRGFDSRWCHWNFLLI